MSSTKKNKTQSKRDILKEPEFLEAFKGYLKNGERYSEPQINHNIHKVLSFIYHFLYLKQVSNKFLNIAINFLI